jgi:hypothetical protein
MMDTVLFFLDSFDNQVPLDNWQRFVDAIGLVVVITVLFSTAVIAILYYWAALRRKVVTPSDLFSPYKPMYWLLLCILAGLVASVISAFQYEPILGPEGITGMGEFVVSAQIGLYTTALVFVLAYLGILLPALTPSKFRYRPLWLFVKTRGARM